MRIIVTVTRSWLSYWIADLKMNLLLLVTACFGFSSPSLLLLVQCAYECPSIMQSGIINKVDSDCYVEPHVGFDWYVTGYCISHFDVEWRLATEHAYATDENIDLLLKGLKSSPISKGKIQTLHVHALKISRIRV